MNIENCIYDPSGSQMVYMVRNGRRVRVEGIGAGKFVGMTVAGWEFHAETGDVHDIDTRNEWIEFISQES